MKSNFKIFWFLIVFVIGINLTYSDIEIGISYFLNGNYELSELMFKRNNFYEKGINLYSDFYLGYLLYLNDKINLSKEIFKRYIDNTSIDNNLRLYSNLIYAECCVLLNEYEEALTVYDKILEKSSISNLESDLLMYSLYGKIYSLYKLKKYNNTLITISLFKSYVSKKKIIKIDPQIEQQIEYILADCWYQKGNYNKAKDIFQNFVTKYKNSPLAAYSNFKLFLIYDNQQNYKEAENILKSLENTTSSLELQDIIKYNLARILLKQKKFNSAIKIYQQMLSNIQNTQFKYHIELELAYCFYQLKNYQKTIEILNKIDTKKEEININKDYLLGLAYFCNKNYEAAIQTFNKFLKLYPATTKWYDDVIYWLGVSYYRDKQFNKAIQTFSFFKNKKSSTYYLAAYLYTAKSYKELKEYELAKLILNSLLEQKNKLNESSVGILLYELAENYKLSYEFQIALQYYKKIIEKNIKDEYLLNSAKISMAEIYNHLNKYDEAERLLSEVLDLDKLPEELVLKAKILYMESKYNLNNLKEVETVADEIVNYYINKLSNDELKYITNLFTKIYFHTKNFKKLIEILEKISLKMNNSEEKLLLDLKIIRIANLTKDYNKLYNKVTRIQKENKKVDVLCITDFYLSKYYLELNNIKELMYELLKFNNYPSSAYKYFTYEEFYELLSICKKNSPETTMYLCENILPYLNFENYQKVELIKNIIESFIGEKEYQKAVKLLSLIKKISQDPYNLAYSEFVIGKIYESTGKTELAKSIYEGIIEKYPESPFLPQIYISLIKYYKNKNENEKAQFYEEQLTVKYPNEEETHKYLFEKAKVLMSNSEYLDAIEIFKKLVNSKSFADISQKLLADCYFNLGKYKEASVEYLRLIYLHPDKIELCSEAQYMVGVCAEKLNLYNEAKKAYISSKEKYPGTLWAQEAELKLKKFK
ncbi:MAG: tetratricopeptide repeat protein [Endomicrobiia bacterium]